MAIEDGTPRRSVENDPIAQVMGILRQLRADVDGLQRGTTLRNASISGGDGLRVIDATGNTVIQLTTTDGGGVVAKDATGADVARFGALANSNPGAYGVEVLVSGTWVQLGAQVATWSTLAGKPSTFPATTPVSSATLAATATEANHTADADGSSYGFANNVAGSTFYALWVGNSAGYKFGRNTSSRRYKQNIRPYQIDPKKLLSLRPVIFDRIPQIDPDTGEPQPAATNEYGLIAEDVAAVLPEIVTYFDFEDGNGPVIDGVRYDLIGLALLDWIQDWAPKLQAVLDRLNAAEKVTQRFTPLGGSTANRPATPVLGQQYLDSNLRKPIWAATVAPVVTWVDALGTTV